MTNLRTYIVKHNTSDKSCYINADSKKTAIYTAFFNEFFDRSVKYTDLTATEVGNNVLMRNKDVDFVQEQYK